MYKIFFCCLALAVIALPFCARAGGETYTGEEIRSAEKKAVPSPVYGEIKKGGSLYSLPSEGSPAFEKTEERERALILRDFSLKWYYVEREEGRAWVKAEEITIPPDGLTAEGALTDREIECYINTHSFKSKTERLIWVDIYRQRIYILKGREGSFRLEKRVVCGTGKNCSPTTRGLFETSDKGEWFYSTRLKSGARFWVRFNESYLFHSVAMDRDKNITDPTLGRRCSNGCVRTSVKDAEYIYKTTPKGTAVWVN